MIDIFLIVKELFKRLNVKIILDIYKLYRHVFQIKIMVILQINITSRIFPLSYNR